MGQPLTTRRIALLTLSVLCLLAVPLRPAVGAERALRPLFAGADRQRVQVPVKLKPVSLDGQPLLARFPTEIRFLPTGTDRPSHVMVIAEKRGALKWADLKTGESGYLFRIPHVGIDIEQGLVGFDFDPQFPARPYIYTHHQSPGGGFGGRSVITRWTMWGDDVRSMTAESSVILEFVQPQGANNGGQVTFGPDGLLYLSFGDGGWQGDPANRAQDPTNLHGTVLRLDVSQTDGTYSVPPDNPFVGGGHLPEVWAFGFRNPWRFDFGPDGELLLADVGQERFEEINQVVRGGNYGWSLREGTSCYGLSRKRSGSCDDEDLIDPIHEYRRAEGRAVIGGKFYEGRKLPALDGRFVFGDYTNGRLWAIAPVGEQGGGDVVALGGFGIAPVCFGRDDAGEVYVGVQGGRIYKLLPGGR